MLFRAPCCLKGGAAGTKTGRWRRGGSATLAALYGRPTDSTVGTDRVCHRPTGCAGGSDRFGGRPSDGSGGIGSGGGSTNRVGGGKVPSLHVRQGRHRSARSLRRLRCSNTRFGSLNLARAAAATAARYFADAVADSADAAVAVAAASTEATAAAEAAATKVRWTGARSSGVRVRTMRRLRTSGCVHCCRGGRSPKRDSAGVAAATASTTMTEGASSKGLASTAPGSAAAGWVTAGCPPATWEGSAFAAALVAGPPKGRPPSTDLGLAAAR